jgi:hypothetical protein
MAFLPLNSTHHIHGCTIGQLHRTNRCCPPECGLKDAAASHGGKGFGRQSCLEIDPSVSAAGGCNDAEPDRATPACSARPSTHRQGVWTGH